MSRQKFIAHIWMWALAWMGAGLSFLFVCPKIILSLSPKITLVITSILGVFFIYHLLKSISLHFNKKLISQNEEKLVDEGLYGKFFHPTCTSAVILFWIIFFFYPDLRVLISNLWITAAIFGWIEIEKSFYRKKQKGGSEEDSNP